MWQNKCIPAEWHKARVACLYKKGDPAMPENYRPISLLAIGYKIFASLLLHRLKTAGAEARITDTQFGFKSKSGTREALFLVRRMIEQSWLKKDHKFIMLALDWSKAFDSIAPSSLLQALRRFGIPEPFVSMIASIYTDRCFFIQDSFSKSEVHAQNFGISQGCPLSPFLFVIVMTVLMHDAVNMMKNKFGIEFSPALVCHAILYADDTLLVEVDETRLQKFMECVMQLGITYGLKLNWDKVECMPIQCECHLTDLLGNAIKQKAVLKYLGANIASSGIVTSELSQKIGLAEHDFKTLTQVWNHANMSSLFKFQVYMACIVQKLLYGLDGAVLSKTDMKKLDAFHVRCVRRILRISHAYISRVSNKFVLQEMGALPLSQMLQERQLILFGIIYRLPDRSALRQIVFKPGGMQLIDIENRRVGRPKKAWAPTTLKHALHICDNPAQLLTIIADPNAWKSHVKAENSRISS